MGLSFRICACQRHGRFVGGSGIPLEVGSRELALAILDRADRQDALAPGDAARIRTAIAASMLAARHEWVDAALQDLLQLWNLAAATVTDPVAFGTVDFHRYHGLADGFGRGGTAA